MIKWKKRLLPVAIAAVLLCLTACSGQTHTADLYEKGVELSEKMGMLAKDENYLAAMISSSEGLDPLFEPVASLDYQNPKATFIVTNIEQTISQLYTQLYGDYPEEIRDILNQRLAGRLPATINTMETGLDMLAVSSSLAVSDAFLDSSLSESQWYLYLYDDGYISLVMYNPGEEGVVQASACLIKSDQLGQAASPEEVENYFAEEVQLDGIAVSQA